MILTLLVLFALVFPDAMPDALPDAAEPVQQARGEWLPGSDGNQYLRDQWAGWWRYETATGRIDSVGRETPKAMEKPKSEPSPTAKKAGHFETRRSCGPNGCVQTQVWVPDAEPSVPLPVSPNLDAAEQPASQDNGEWAPRRFFWRR